MEYANRPLVKRLVKFQEAAPVSFHVPGHKNGTLSGLPTDLRMALSYDLTELEGLDDLHQPQDVIREAEQKLAELYGSDRSFFLVNGSTVGNLAMVYATCGEGEKVIVQRNAHKSIFNAIELTRATPVFITPEWDDATRTVGTVTAEQIEKALEIYPDTKAVILTYPTYYGKTGEELAETIQLCHDKRVPVLVDEAHGAHFVIGEPFPHSALALGADVVVHSAHKTLPAMTMASFLHVQSEFIAPERIAHYLQMLQSSSPSYLLMASLDDARAFVESYSEKDINSFSERRTSVIQRLNCIEHLQTIDTDDPLKLMVRIEGYSGFTIQKELDAVGVYAELADPYQVLFVLPLLKKEHDYPFEGIAKKIELAVSRVVQSTNRNYLLETPMVDKAISTLSYSVKELEEFESDWTPYEEAVGMVAAASITPYPPGIPLLLAGERVMESHLQSLASLLKMGAYFQGAIRVKEKQIFVVINEAEE